MSNPKFVRKLNLNKEVLANLSREELGGIVGGSGSVDSPAGCTPTYNCASLQPGATQSCLTTACHLGTTQYETVCSKGNVNDHNCTSAGCGIGNWPK